MIKHQDTITRRNPFVSFGDKMLFFRRFCLLLLCASLCALPVGCGGESTQDKMMRIAKERAVRNRADKEAEAQQEKKAEQAKPATVAADQLAADRAPTDKSSAEKPKEK